MRFNWPVFEVRMQRKLLMEHKRFQVTFYLLLSSLSFTVNFANFEKNPGKLDCLFRFLLTNCNTEEEKLPRSRRDFLNNRLLLLTSLNVAPGGLGVNVFEINSRRVHEEILRVKCRGSSHIINRNCLAAI